MSDQGQPTTAPPADTPAGRDYVRTVSRSMLHDIFIDDYAQKCAIQREAHAINLGLNPYPYARPFPGSSVQVQLPQPTTAAPSKLLPIAAGALAATGVLGPLGGLLLALLSQQPTPPAVDPAVAPPAIIAPAEPGPDNDTRYNLNLRVE